MCSTKRDVVILHLSALYLLMKADVQLPLVNILALQTPEVAVDCVRSLNIMVKTNGAMFSKGYLD